MRRCRPKGDATQQEEDMQHLDEGTIHAWLDGQLPRDEAHQVEAHVAECRECADAVAEARGLIAASSRILTALDSVPGEVVPKQAPFRTEAEAARANAIADAAADAIVPLDLVVRRAPRRWFNGASLAAAAAIVVGIGTVATMQRSSLKAPAAADATASTATVPAVPPAPAADSLGAVRNAVVGTSVDAPKRPVTSADAANEGNRRDPTQNAAKKEAESQTFAAATTTVLRDTALSRGRAVAANKPVDELAKDTKQLTQAQRVQPLQAAALPRREQLAAIQAAKLDSAPPDQAKASADAAGVATGGLKGRVIDASDNGVAGASVSVEGTTTAVVTNTAGEFAISGLQGGAHRISVRRVGYQPVDRDITVTPGRTLQTDVVLNASPVALNDVVVTSAAGAAPRAAPSAKAKTAPARAQSVDTAPGAPITAEQSNAVGCYDLGITATSVSRNGFRQVPRRIALDSEIVPANADGVWYRARDLARTNPVANGLWRPSGSDAIELEFTFGSRTARIRVAGPPDAMMRGSVQEIDRATATGEGGNVVAVRRSCAP
jgi:anti-sigma factor RsiW